ncbi:MAG: pyridoxal phosphate-dependent class II aminotransferase [Phascolarctobacterium sp.]|nr:pyridoxal phosphate-dependent class II aminotransferase [Phascolarctobacterium sp.]
MYRYEHGGDVYTEKIAPNGKPFIDFSANINPLGLPQSIKKAVQDALKQCINYPDPFCRDLKKATAKFLNIKPDYLFFGNGAADCLFRLALALKPKNALLLAPTFADYEKALRTVDCKIKYYELKESQSFAVQEDILSKITVRTDFVVICNPNNPTGQLTDKKLLTAILERCKEVGAYLMIDECFMDFIVNPKDFSMVSALPDNKNLVIVKAFTKTFAMPGIRLGYLVTSDNNLIAKLHESGQDWNVSALAQMAGIAALSEESYLYESHILINEEREYLKAQLTNVGAKIYGSHANYIFFKLDRPDKLVEDLHKQGYLIRSCANYNNLSEHFYRVAVKTRVLNRGLIKAIKEAKKHAFFINFD